MDSWKDKNKVDLTWLKGNNNLLLLLITAGTLFLDNVDALGNWGIPLKAVLMIILFGMNAKILYNDYQKSKQEEIDRKNERSSLVLSHVTKLLEGKTKQVKGNTYVNKDTALPKGLNCEEPTFYRIHDYLGSVCMNLRDIVATIMDNKPECIDVSLIYNYANESQWKWIIGRSGSSQATSLSDLINDDSSFFHYMIFGDGIKSKEYVFYNDKNDLVEDAHYTWGRRDELSGYKGSLMGWRLTAFNNEHALVNAVLVISTYGANFVEQSKGRKKEKEFESILLSEILPYYISMIQPELCLMYLSHEKKKKTEQRLVGGACK